MLRHPEAVVDAPVKIKGKTCPYYSSWHRMLTRAYSEAYHESRPTYKGVSVCKEWLTFSNYKSWMQQQDWQGKALDKDLLVPGNKIYSPETCIFVPASLNSLLISSRATRGENPLGVYYSTRHKKYVAHYTKQGKPVYLGYHATASEASAAYIAAKATHVEELAALYEPRLKAALLAAATRIRQGLHV